MITFFKMNQNPFHFWLCALPKEEGRFEDGVQLWWSVLPPFNHAARFRSSWYYSASSHNEWGSHKKKKKREKADSAKKKKKEESRRTPQKQKVPLTTGVGYLFLVYSHWQRRSSFLFFFNSHCSFDILDTWTPHLINCLLCGGQSISASHLKRRPSFRRSAMESFCIISKRIVSILHSTKKVDCLPLCVLSLSLPLSLSIKRV